MMRPFMAGLFLRRLAFMSDCGVWDASRVDLEMKIR